MNSGFEELLNIFNRHEVRYLIVGGAPPARCRHECRSGTHECAMPLSFPNSAHLHKWWGGRPRPHPAPWPACRWWQAPDSSREERDEGVPRGPGGPPSNYAESPALRKLSGIAQECVRHIWRVRRCETIFAPALSRAFHRYTLLRE